MQHIYGVLITAETKLGLSHVCGSVPAEPEHLR